MPMASSLTSAVKRLAISTGTYRPARWVARFLRRSQGDAFRRDVALYRSLIAPGVLCFDVGANIGDKSEAMLEAGARVVAFEPNPSVVAELRARCGGRRDWTLIEAALGSRAAIARLHGFRFHGQASLHESWVGSVVETHNVPVVTLDAAIECFGRPDFCKIDVEGWEPEVLRGLSQPIRLLSFESHLSPAGIQRTQQCLELLRQFGPSLVNLTPAESANLHLPAWVPIDAFARWFPGDLRQTLPGLAYGDIIVRNTGLPGWPVVGSPRGPV